VAVPKRYPSRQHDFGHAPGGPQRGTEAFREMLSQGDRRARKGEHCPQFSTSERQEAARFSVHVWRYKHRRRRRRPIRETTRSTGLCVKGSSGHVREISHHIPRVSPAAAVLQAAILAAALDLRRKAERDFTAGQPPRHRSASERDDRAGPPSQHMFSDIGALLTRSMRGAPQHVHPPDTAQAAAHAAGQLRPPACQWIPGLIVDSPAPMPRLISPPGLGG
jgi:hypothetical protein